MNPTDLHRYPIDYAGDEPTDYRGFVETPSTEDGYESPVALIVIFILLLASACVGWVIGRFWP